MIIYSALPGHPPLLSLHSRYWIDLRTGQRFKRDPLPSPDMAQMLEDILR